MVDDILITGGCGFIGAALAKTILEANPAANIRVLDNLSVRSKDDLAGVGAFTERGGDELSGPHGLELVVGDVRDYECCLKTMRGVRHVAHFAGSTGVNPSVQDPAWDFGHNVVGSFNLLEAARASGVKRFVFASSSAAVGQTAPPLREELPCHPISPYGAAKAAVEGYCQAYSHCYGIQTACLRFGNVYGPGSSHKQSVVAKFIRRALTGKVCDIHGDGGQTRDFVYIDDLVDAILKALTEDVSGEVFQIASGREHTVNEVADAIARTLNERTGTTMRVSHGPARLGDVRRNYSDVSKASRLLGWRAGESLESGIAKTVEYFVSLAGTGQ